jgi:hypothetical protein
LEGHRLDRARAHIKQARKARNYDTPVDWWEHGRWGTSVQRHRREW